MDAPVGATVRGYSRCPEFSVKFFRQIHSTSDFGRGLGWFVQSTFRSTIPQLTRRKRRAGGRVMTDSDMGLDVMFEGTQRGMPRKRALFGPGCSESVSPVSDVAEA